MPTFHLKPSKPNIPWKIKFSITLAWVWNSSACLSHHLYFPYIPLPSAPVSGLSPSALLTSLPIADGEKNNYVTIGHDLSNNPSLFPSFPLCLYLPAPVFPQSQDLEHSFVLFLEQLFAQCVRLQGYRTRHSYIPGRFDYVFGCIAVCAFANVSGLLFAKLIP